MSIARKTSIGSLIDLFKPAAEVSPGVPAGTTGQILSRTNQVIDLEE
jgi:hypothetical protein